MEKLLMGLHFGNCLEVMRGIESGSVDAVITDPPYGEINPQWDCRVDLGGVAAGR